MRETKDSVFVEALHSGTCACLDAKLNGRAFCRMCFYSLEPQLRATLAAREIGDGFEAAYRVALRQLVMKNKVNAEEARRFEVKA
jgi:hypothetical protein